MDILFCCVDISTVRIFPLYISCFLRHTDVDECSTGNHRCSQHASCENTEGSYRCQCYQGFTGNGIMCKDINECQTQNYTCSPHSECRNTIGGYVCVCEQGYNGHCDECEGKCTWKYYFTFLILYFNNLNYVIAIF